MKLFSVIIVTLVVMVSAFGQSIKDLGDLGRQVIKQTVGREVGRQASKEHQRSIDNLMDSTNREFNRKFKSFRLPEDSRVAVEIDQNSTSVPDAQLIGIAKSSLEDWWDGLVPSANFRNRNEVKQINATDRDNPELRNPIPVGQMTNRGYDVHLTAVERWGMSGLRIDTDILHEIFRRSLFGVSGDIDELRQMTFVELTVEFRDAATQESVRTIHVIGCDLDGYSINVDLQSRRFGATYRRDQRDNLPRALTDAFNRAQQVAEGKVAAKRR